MLKAYAIIASEQEKTKVLIVAQKAPGYDLRGFLR